MTLKEGASLQDGKYIIKKVLGQGGFGITYLAEHCLLGTEVAIKEFFMKDFCNRDTTTSHVTIGTENARLQVQRFREKFIKEARNIAKLRHPNIIRISDVFEENGTAYYVMDYCEGGSLADLIKHHPEGLEEVFALKYIQQVASALEHIHERKMNHLDVKPANILLDAPGNAILIDFGLSKQYDPTGGQTSTTPVGISHGFAPIEQYKQGGVKEFSPATDIYSLGATLYKLITGQTPPDAQILVEDNLPSFTASAQVTKAIIQSMHVRRQDRPQSIQEFINLLDSKEASTSTPTEKATSKKKEDNECTVVLDVTGNEDLSIKGTTSEYGFSDNKETCENNNEEKGAIRTIGNTNKDKRHEEEGKGNEINKEETKSINTWIYVICAIVFAFVLFMCNVSDKGKRGIETISTNNTETVVEQEPTPKKETAFVYFSSSPKDAEVYVDGRYLSKTPFSTSIKYGKHSVTMSKEGYQSDINTIEIPDSLSETNYSITLKPNESIEELTPNRNVTPSKTYYNVSIKSNAPKTRVWIDGGYSDVYLPKTTKLEKGQHSLTASSNGYKRREMKFYVEKQNQIINIELVKENEQTNSGNSSNARINVRGTIKDSDGKPISGTVVNAKSSGKTGVSDRNGNFEIKGATQGETLTVITAEKTYTQTASSSVSFVVNSQQTNISYTEFVVRGTIKDTDGKPISGTVVNAKSSGKTGVSDRNGNFEIKGATQGETLTVITAEKTYTQTASSSVSFVIQETTNQTITVRGTVVDKKGEPLIGTSIQIKGSTKGTVADIDGNFVLNNVPKGVLLEFSFVGYKKQTLSASPSMRIVMK